MLEILGVFIVVEQNSNLFKVCSAKYNQSSSALMARLNSYQLDRLRGQRLSWLVEGEIVNE